MILKKFLQNRAITGAAIGLIIAGCISLISFFNVFHGLHLKFADSLYIRNEPSDEIIIVTIDEKSNQSFLDGGLGRYSQWSRDNFTNLLEVLKQEGPSVITLDILFNNATQTLPFENIRLFQEEIEENLTTKEKLQAYEAFLRNNSSTIDNAIDNTLKAKFKELGNVIIIFSTNNGNPIFPLQKFIKETTIAFFNAQPDNDGILRRIEPVTKVENGIYDDLAVASVRKHLNAKELQEGDFNEDFLQIYTEDKDIEIPLENGKMNVNFFGNPFSYKMVSFVDVLNGNYDTGIFKNKIVLIGVTAFRTVQDDVLTPKSNKVPMPGVEFRANEIQTILDQKFLTNQSTLSKTLTIAGIAVGLTIALNYIGIILSIILTLLAIAAYIFAAHFFYRRGIILNMVFPFLTIVLTYLASWVYKYFIADRKKREIKSAFGHYVGKDLAEIISKNPDMVKLGGEKKVVTVFFSDIKDSTSISEITNIELWVGQINEYFTVMERILKDAGGTLDKYEGDAIMGFWNAPVTQEDHIIRAYNTALKMREALDELNKKWHNESKPTLEMRIGINTGEAIVGNFGSEDRFDYTVMGDTVNTASRLESSANKTYGTKIIVADGDHMHNEALSCKPQDLSQFALRELDIVLLPGKKDPVKIFELLCSDTSPNCTAIRNWAKMYADGLTAYRKSDWDAAIKAFASLPDDPPSKVMLDRCKTLKSGGIVTGLQPDMVFKILNK